MKDEHSETETPREDLTGDRLLKDVPTNPEGFRVLGRYPILSRIGSGAMGAVYRAQHPGFQTEVAVKVLFPHLMDLDPGLVTRFWNEARIAAKLNDKHLVRVFDVDKQGDTHFLVMEYVPGGTAGDYLKEHKQAGHPALPEREALEIVAAATRGLATAHRNGIIHRDIKPDNILIPDGRLSEAKLADLGLAKPEGSVGTFATLSHIGMGTPGYMPPEQIRDARTASYTADVFAMGATLYVLVSGEKPFSGTSVGAILMNTETERPRPLPERVSPATRAVVERCLSRKPEDRFEDGGKLLDALQEALEGRGAPQRVKRGLRPPIPIAWAFHRSFVWIAAPIVSVIILGAVTIVVSRLNDADEARDTPPVLESLQDPADGENQAAGGVDAGEDGDRSPPPPSGPPEEAHSGGARDPSNPSEADIGVPGATERPIPADVLDARNRTLGARTRAESLASEEAGRLHVDGAIMCLKQQLAAARTLSDRAETLFNEKNYPEARDAYGRAQAAFLEMGSSAEALVPARDARRSMEEARAAVDPRNTATREYGEAESLRGAGETDFRDCRYRQATASFEAAQSMYRSVPGPADAVSARAETEMNALRAAMMRGDWEGVPESIQAYYTKQWTTLTKKNDIVEVDIRRKPPVEEGSAFRVPVSMTVDYRQRGTDNSSEVVIERIWILTYEGGLPTVSAVQE